MPLSSNNGFSEEEISQCRGWSLPDVSNGGEISATVEKKQSAKRNAPHQEPNDTEQLESIEDIDDAEIETPAQVISAEQLQEITDAAEKEGYQTGFEKGLDEGKKKGVEKGLQEAKQIVTEQSQRLQHIIDALLLPLENEKKQIENLLVDMTCRLTETLIERELKTDSTHIIHLVDQILRLLPRSIPSYTLYLNPNDIELLEQHLEAKNHASSTGTDTQYHLEKDDSLLPGGCRLESSHASVDATAETKIKVLLDDFIQRRHIESAKDTPQPPVKEPASEKDKRESPIKKEKDDTEK